MCIRDRVLFRVNDDQTVRELAKFAPSAGAEREPIVTGFEWKLSEHEIRGGDVVRYWAEAVDRNTVTGPGTASSKRFSIFVLTPQQEEARVAMQLEEFAQLLEGLSRLQKENRARTTNGDTFGSLLTRQGRIHKGTQQVAALMERSALSLIHI